MNDRIDVVCMMFVGGGAHGRPEIYEKNCEHQSNTIQRQLLPRPAAAGAVFVLCVVDVLGFLIYFWSLRTSKPYKKCAPHVYSIFYSMSKLAFVSQL